MVRNRMANTSLRYKLLDDPEDFPTLEAGWEDLCKAVADQVTVFASFLWYQNWWKHYSAGAKLRLFSMYRGDTLLGIAPLMLKKFSFHKLPVRTVGFLQNNQSLHNDFIVVPEFRTIFLEKLIKTLFVQASQWDALYFRNICPESDNFKSLLKVLSTGGLSWRHNPTYYDSPYLIPSGNWSDYFAGRSRRTRKTLKNIQNRMHKAGKVSVRNIRTPAEFLACKEELFDVARQSWTEKLGDSLGSPVNREFFQALAISAASKGWLSIWALYLDDRMIAIEFHLQAYNRVHMMRGHYHPEFASLSPGTYLEMRILEELFEVEKNIKTIDFCGCFDDYKKKWTNTSVPHNDLFVFKEKLYSKYLLFHEFKLVPYLKKAIPYSPVN